MIDWQNIPAISFANHYQRWFQAALTFSRFLIGLFEYGRLLWLVIVKKARTNSFFCLMQDNVVFWEFSEIFHFDRKI